MWIRSQRKNALVDINFMRVINDGNFCLICGATTDGFDCDLGIYSSEEKAIRVLDAIHGQLNEFDLEGTVVYQMPSDEEVGLWFPEKEDIFNDDSDEEDDI